MPLSEENQQWVKQQINEALYPNGFRRFANWLRYWGLSAVVVTLVLGMTALVVTLALAVMRNNGDNARFQQRTEDRLAAIEASLLALRATKAIEEPASQKSQQEAKLILANAKMNGIRLPESIVNEAISEFAKAAQKSPTAWDVALEFASYRTSLNPPLNKPVTRLPSERLYIYGGNREVPGKPLPTVFYSNDSVPYSESSRLRKVGAKDLNAGANFGPAFLLFIGGAYDISGMEIRGIVFQGVEIHYDGQSEVIRSNLGLINCSFVFADSVASRKLMEEIATSPHIR